MRRHHGWVEAPGMGRARVERPRLVAKDPRTIRIEKYETSDVLWPHEAKADNLTGCLILARGQDPAGTQSPIGDPLY